MLFYVQAHLSIGLQLNSMNKLFLSGDFECYPHIKSGPQTKILIKTYISSLVNLC